MDPGKIKETFLLWFNSRIVRQFAFSSMWMFCARFSWIAAAFTVGVLTTRHLGPHNFGVVSYVVAYVGMFSVIASLGVDSIVVRDYVLKPEQSGRIMGNFFVFKILSVLVMLLAVAVSLCFIRDRQTLVFCLIISTGYFFSPLQTVSAVFQVKVKTQYLAFAELLSCGIYNSVRLWAVLTDQPLVVFVVAETLLQSVPPLLFFGFYCWKIGNPFHWSFRWKEAVLLIVPALPLSVTAILSGVYARTDILMLQHYSNAEAVGCYAIATKFTENMALVFSMLSGIFSVVVIQACKDSREMYEKQFHRFVFMMFYLTIPAILLSFLLGRPVIRWLYGDAFLPAVRIFYVYVLTLSGTAVINCFSCHAVNENRLVTIAAVYCSGVLLNIPLNMFLIPRFGGSGAAAASVVSMSGGLILVLLCSVHGRADLRMIVRSLTHFPNLTLNKADPEDNV